MKLADTGLTAQELKAKAKKYIIELAERFDFIAESAKDQYMYDEKGEKYLDFYAGIAVNSAGNCNEKVVNAVIDQVSTLMPVSYTHLDVYKRQILSRMSIIMSFIRIA